MARYTISKPIEGYTVIKLRDRYYPMSVSFTAEGDPEVSPLRDASQKSISYAKRNLAVAYTYMHRSMVETPSPS